MGVHIMHDVEKNQDWVEVKGDYEQFYVYGDNEDYVEDTKLLMQKMAITCFTFPLYVHFEGYEDEVESVLSHQDTFDIYYQPSGRKVLTMSGLKIYRAEIPSFMVTIPNKKALENVFSQWFHLAMENNMWLISQEANVLYYENKFATIELKDQAIILVTEHDAQGFSVITNYPLYQDLEYLRLIFDK
ncbi:hypothetical protein A21D_03028 [Virgibacillus dokdonensis]|uniref:Uncharacterized protein n=2 Tax=Virgibacillus dokdonensis TaxID=302167 RepID=A0A2K9J8J7_9BACI|nr:hypothetical protein A21D_03028 [Virgibacillus dokdonensis]